MHGGHYVAYVQTTPLPEEACSIGNSNSRWFHFSDNHVRPVSESEVLSVDAYLLFYARDGAETLSF